MNSSMVVYDHEHQSSQHSQANLESSKPLRLTKALWTGGYLPTRKGLRLQGCQHAFDHGLSRDPVQSSSIHDLLMNSRT